MVRRLAATLRDTDAIVVRHEVFGSIAAHAETLRAVRREFGNLDWPVTWVEGAAAGGGIAGMNIFAVAGTRVDTLRLDEQPVGRVFSDGRARYCLLGNVRPSNISISKPAQTREVFETLERALREAGMGMANLARTWFFLDDMLSWYAAFNNVRTEFYRQWKVFNGLVPASTGLGGKNPASAALVAGAWAVQAAEEAVTVREVPSPLQCPSLEYGSAFSRAVMLVEPGGRRLLVSGTASITPDGHSAHTGDVRQQIALTMEVAWAILVSRGFDFPDVTRATAYFKNIQDAPAFDAWRTEHGLKSLPLVTAQSDICRAELLFEIELDAVAPARE
jgi:enamine deaminase RidA (YjgF/YER057c/UK114 family)